MPKGIFRCWTYKSLKKILVLAGGFGSRLKSVVFDLPKPLAPVCGRPFLLYLIENYVSQGGREFIFLLHYEATLIQSMIAEMSSYDNFSNIKITFIVEDKPLGTGGSIKNAINFLNIRESFLVVNADTWLGDGLRELNCSTPNSIAAVTVKDCSRYGTLVVDNDKVTNFLEKDSYNRRGLINAGLYHLSPDIFLDSTKSRSFSLESRIFPAIAKKMGLNAVQVVSDFIDIGIPEDYFRFCEWIRAGKTSEL